MRILLGLFLSVVGYVSCQNEVPHDCSGVRNESPLLEIEPVPLKTVTNGQSWLMKNGSDFVYIAKVSGSAYEMGYAQGELFKEELQKQIKNLEAIYPDNIQSTLDTFGVPDEFIAMIPDNWLTMIGEVLLDMNWAIAYQWIPQRYIDELQGMADASGVSYTRLRRANLLPELIQAHCTVMGAWDKGTADGKLYHLRALDWDAFAPINEFPTIIIYEPTEEGSKTFANINYLGWIGTLTSISKIGISVGEKVMLPRQASDYPAWPDVTYYGKPWQFTLRDVVQFANNIEEVNSQLLETKRTMRIHGGWGSLPDKTFRGMNFAANFVELIDDHDYVHNNPVSHPQLDGVFYFDKHVQPSSDTCVAQLVVPQYGKITPEFLYRDIAGIHATGDNMWVVMDPEGQQIWMASSEYGVKKEAYKRSPINIQLSQFW